MDKTTYYKDKVVNILRGTTFTGVGTLYLALFTTVTTDAGGGTEVVGGSYARQAITLGVPSDGVSVSTNSQTFTNMPAVTIIDGALFDASVAGNMLMHGDWSASMIMTLGQTLVISAGFVTVNEQ